jgi:hypothetical protein
MAMPILTQTQLPSWQQMAKHCRFRTLAGQALLEQ